MTTIADSTRSSLQDVRQVLPATQQTAPRSPGLARLLEGVRSSGREIVDSRRPSSAPGSACPGRPAQYPVPDPPFEPASDEVEDRAVGLGAVAAAGVPLASRTNQTLPTSWPWTSPATLSLSK